MYFNVVGDGVTELFKTAYKIVPVNIVDGEFSVPEEHPLKEFFFDEYDYCFNFLRDFYEHRDKFFAEDGYNWDKEAFEGFDHFDILHVVLKTTERDENGAVVPVLSETVASVKAGEEYPFALINKPNDETEAIEESDLDAAIERLSNCLDRIKELTAGLKE